jgi:hypothetical protein
MLTRQAALMIPLAAPQDLIDELAALQLDSISPRKSGPLLSDF